MAFIIAVLFACATILVLEDGYYSDRPFWGIWRFHLPSLFVGTAAFVGLLYFLQRMNDKRYALKYVEPYAPLLVFSGLNLVFKLSAGWFALIAVGCITWSVLQVRQVRDTRTSPHRTRW
jgi:uncharacterized membrane protein YedE/YeeE